VSESSFFMRGNSIIENNELGGVFTPLSGVVVMEDSAKIISNNDPAGAYYAAGVTVMSYSRFRMGGNAEISGHDYAGVYLSSLYFGDGDGPMEAGASAVIGGNAGIHHNTRGIWGRLCDVSLTDNASVSYNIHPEDSGFYNNLGFDGYGGVLISNGNFTLNKRASVTGNRGMGVYLQAGIHAGVNLSANFTMADEAVIARNTNTDVFDDDSNTVQGGGVHLLGTDVTFTMTGGSIAGNSSQGEGGGVFVGDTVGYMQSGHGAVFILLGGTVSGNSSGATGGGVAVAEGAIFTKPAASVIYGANEPDSSKKNTATGGGAAVWVENGTGLGDTFLNTTVGAGTVLELPYTTWEDPS
jgi:hypothetical protein